MLKFKRMIPLHHLIIKWKKITRKPKISIFNTLFQKVLSLHLQMLSLKSRASIQELGSTTLPKVRVRSHWEQEKGTSD